MSPHELATRHRVLVVDDEPNIATAIMNALKRDHDVLTAEGADQAIKLLGEKKVDCIICDLMMPQKSGIEFYEELKTTFPHLVNKVIFMTGGAFTARARNFLKSIENEIIEKPFQLDQLRHLVDQM